MNQDTQRFSIAEDPFLRALFTEMPCACMYHELFRDDRGNPVDYAPLEANPGFARVIGIDPSPIIGRRASQYLPADDARHWLSVFAPAALQGKTVNFHLYSPQTDQTFYGTAISPEPGYFLSMFTVVGNTAIPALVSGAGRRAPRERLSAADFARNIFETMPCAGMISRINLDDRARPIDYTVTDVNFAFCELMDTDRGEIVGTRASERLGESEFRHWLDTFASVALNGITAREALYIPRRKCACVGVAIRPEPGTVMTIFTHLDSCGYILKGRIANSSDDETGPEC